MEDKMDNQKIGRFIAERRKAQHMTQKDLAERLYITDKAVSKWERGLSLPDVTLLSAIAAALDVTMDELLTGEKASVPETVSHPDDRAINNASHRDRILGRTMYTCVFSGILLIGALVCGICDMAITGSFTWSLYPITSIAFAWLLLFPLVWWKGHGVLGCLLTLSIFLIPFLYVLDHVIQGSPSILPIGIRMAVISLVFLWGIFGLFCLLRNRKVLAAAISCLLAACTCLIINISLSRLLAQPVVDVWDIGVMGLFLIVSLGLFLLDHRNRAPATK